MWDDIYEAILTPWLATMDDTNFEDIKHELWGCQGGMFSMHNMKFIHFGITTFHAKLDLERLI